MGASVAEDKRGGLVVGLCPLLSHSLGDMDAVHRPGKSAGAQAGEGLAGGTG